MPVGKRVRKLKDILPRWQDDSGNLHGLAKSQERFLIPLVAKSWQAQDESAAQ
jgi:hypothetical protein